MKRTANLVFIMFLLSLAGNCNASVIRFDDLTEQLSVTLDGLPIANGGRVSNLLLVGETAQFDLTVQPDITYSTFTAFTMILEPANADDPIGTVSDVFVFSFTADANQPNGTYHVIFGSDPSLPLIPLPAVDLTTIPEQGLPSNPFYENGDFQLVGTAFFPSFSDTFFLRSDVSAAPEPASLALLGFGLAGLGFSRRKRAS